MRAGLVMLAMPVVALLMGAGPLPGPGPGPGPQAPDLGPQLERFT